MVDIWKYETQYLSTYICKVKVSKHSPTMTENGFRPHIFSVKVKRNNHCLFVLKQYITHNVTCMPEI